MKSWMSVIAAALLVSTSAAEPPEGVPVIRIADRRTPPSWAVKQRLLIETQDRAVEKFYAHYFDQRGWYKGHLTWGTGIGSDDIMQGLANWPLLYALGGSDEVLRKYYRAFHGNVAQLSSQQVEAAPPWGVMHNGFVAADDMFHIEQSYHLVNVSQTAPRTVVVQTGAYGEHQCLRVTHNGHTTEVNHRYFVVHLAPGSGGYLELKVKRFANPPQARLPWQPSSRSTAR